MNLTRQSARLHFKAQRFALMWAKEHLPEEQYQEIKKSYDSLLKRTTAFVLLGCIPIILAFLLLAIYTPVSKGMEKAAVPEGATGSVMARVDYDGNFYWTQDSKKYEYALQDYGIAAEQYEFGDQVKVYVNDAQKII